MCERHSCILYFLAFAAAFVNSCSAASAHVLFGWSVTQLYFLSGIARGYYWICLKWASDEWKNKIADFIHPCNNTEPACLIKATQDAIPEFTKGLPQIGVPSLDPFIIDELPVQLPGIKVTFIDGKVTGLRKCEVLNVEAHLEKNVFILEVRCNITIKGKYTAVGRLLLFSINGEGDAKIKIVNSIIKMNIKTKYFKDAEGRDHFGIKSYRYAFDYGERIHYTISNLFKGNPEISNTVLRFLNENWRVVTEEFGQPVVDYAMNVTIETARKFFDAVPYDELLYVPLPKY